MKKWIAVLAALFTAAALLSSCAAEDLFKSPNLFRTDSDRAEATMEQLLEAIENKDLQAFKSLFSLKILCRADGFDQGALTLFEYYQGNYVSFENRWGGASGEKTWDYGETLEILRWSYEVTTSEGIYRFAIEMITIDTANPDNLGIHSLYIIKWEDDDYRDMGYSGDRLYSPGIHIGVKNTPPKELSDSEFFELTSGADS